MVQDNRIFAIVKRELPVVPYIHIEALVLHIVGCVAIVCLTKNRHSFTNVSAHLRIPNGNAKIAFILIDGFVG